MKIKVKEITEGCKFGTIKKGDWIDLRAAETVTFLAPQAGVRKRASVDSEIVSTRDVNFDFKLINLGIALKLPKGYEAALLPRSGTFKNFGVICANSEGVIDNSYCGNNDEWRFPAIALRTTTIVKGDRICQFRIQLSQKATKWQKLKWLFTSKIKFEWVTDLGSVNRGGFGSTGVK